MDIRLDGRVALVTGAGRGLGRAHAVALAARGAQVVVNDVGSDVQGDGTEPDVAASTVEEIRAAGGVAVADTASISTPEGARHAVHTAVEAFGQLDIVVNNAGHLRSKPFLEHTPDDLAALLAVHVSGSFFVSQAAFEVMAEAGYGRFVFTTSVGGLRGNPLVAGYGAAKAGIVGLANVVALAGASHGIKANTISPYASTRMATVASAGRPQDPAVQERSARAGLMGPELVSAVVVYLASEGCQLNHTILTAGGGAVARTAMVIGSGWRPEPGIALTPEAVRDHLDAILDLSQPSEPLTSEDEAALFLRPIQEAARRSPPGAVSP